MNAIALRSTARDKHPDMRFTKMHGCGNDYVYLDGIAEALPPMRSWPALARRLSDRHTGIGGDGLIVLLPPTRAGTRAGADCRMAMFNADGSSSAMCGNGIRCLAALASAHGHVAGDALAIETPAGLRHVELLRHRGRVIAARVDMGAPIFDPAGIPVRPDGKAGPRSANAATSQGTALRPVVLEVGPGPGIGASAKRKAGSKGSAAQPLRAIAIGMGNPHAVCFVDDPDAPNLAVAELGARIEKDPRFPAHTNVEFVARRADERGLPVLRQRTWERGSGETMACGTGACASVVAAILTQRIAGRSAVVRLSGGDLRIDWPHEDASVIMTGEAITVFTGEIA